jgi:hypothetical protein
LDRGRNIASRFVGLAAFSLADGLNGRIVEVMTGTGQGKTLGKYGEAHCIAVNSRDQFFVADTLNRHIQKDVRKQPVEFAGREIDPGERFTGAVPDS